MLTGIFVVLVCLLKLLVVSYSSKEIIANYEVRHVARDITQEFVKPNSLTPMVAVRMLSFIILSPVLGNETLFLGHMMNM